MPEGHSFKQRVVARTHTRYSTQHKITKPTKLIVVNGMAPLWSTQNPGSLVPSRYNAQPRLSSRVPLGSITRPGLHLLHRESLSPHSPTKVPCYLGFSPCRERGYHPTQPQSYSTSIWQYKTIIYSNNFKTHVHPSNIRKTKSSYFNIN